MFYWDPKPELFTLPGINFPILWYGFFFAFGFWISSLLLFRLFLQFLRNTSSPIDLHSRARKIVDHLSLYLVIATLVGARLGHLIFYENPSLYLSDPLEIFRIRNGGLASHGAVFAVLIAMVLFTRSIRKVEKSLSFLRLLDLLAIVAPLTAACIRIGNFFNQEILGHPTSFPLAITFGHPADGSLPTPCHPVQLYEAATYFSLFFLMWRLWKTSSFFRFEGKLAGLLFFNHFSSRFLL
ncbi:MAG: prolipoprotein diacylglyceryl transferase [Chlamydiia bacterium]|nr:prolipoprotein diacylglyceryl transferase [Chlamydiia bacterium]